MKKIHSLLLAGISCAGILLGGCSLSNNDAREAVEYIGDTASEEDSSVDDASARNSIVVVNDLFEPILEETSSSKDSDKEEKEEEKEDEQKEETESDVEDADKVNIVFFGDSQFANGRDDGSDLPTLTGKRVPNSVIYNLGIGGTTASIEASTNDVSPSSLTSTSFLGMTYCLTGASDRNRTLESYPDVLETMNRIDPETVDYYVIEYGANDFINGAALDSTENVSRAEGAHAYYNALCAGIDELSEISPDATFILLTPFYGIYTTDDGTYIGDSYIVSNGVGTLADYARKMTNVSEDKHTYLLDCMFMTKCDLYLDTASEYLMDNLHLSLTGRQIFSRLLDHILNFTLKNEPYAYLETDFIKIAEFDPDEYYRYDERMMKEYYAESWEKYIKGVFPLAQPSEEALEEYGSGEDDD